MSSTSSPKTKASMAWTCSHVANIRSQTKSSVGAHTKIVFHPTFPAGSKTVSNLAFFHRQSSGSATAPTDLRRLPRPLAHHAGFDPPRPRRGEICGVLQFDGIKHGHHWRGIIALPQRINAARPANTVTFAAPGRSTSGTV